MIVMKRRKFLAGVLGLVGFFVVLTLWMSPVAGEQTGLQWADDFFNRLSKNSSDHLQGLEALAPRFDGRAFEAKITVKGPEEAARVAALFTSADMEAEASGNGVRLQGDLGRFGRTVLADADLLFHDRNAELEARHGMSGKEAVYWWWTAAGEIYKHCVRRGDISASNFASALRTKACEPAYNYAGIPATPVAEAKLRLAFLLGFYLFYTVWYGFAIMWIFEGLGISASRRGRKAEA